MRPTANTLMNARKRQLLLSLALAFAFNGLMGMWSDVARKNIRTAMTSPAMAHENGARENGTGENVQQENFRPQSFTIPEMPPAAVTPYGKPDFRTASAVQSTITQQLDALRQADGERAFAFASPSVQRRYGSAETFLIILKKSHRDLISARSVKFMTAEQSSSGSVLQQVMVTNRNGHLGMFIYQLEPQKDGTWRISGCAALEPDERDA